MFKFKLGSSSANQAYGQGPRARAFPRREFHASSEQSDGRTRNRRKRGATLPPVVRSVRAAPFVAGQPSLELHSFIMGPPISLVQEAPLNNL